MVIVGLLLSVALLMVALPFQRGPPAIENETKVVNTKLTDVSGDPQPYGGWTGTETRVR